MPLLMKDSPTQMISYTEMTRTRGGVLHQGDELVAHGDDALDHLEQGDLEEDLALGHAQHLAYSCWPLGTPWMPPR